LAEQARVNGDRLQAATYYEIAIQEAIANGYLQKTAIAVFCVIYQLRAS
jgi:hypothetical protein